ncbi:hypothetical protein CUMW_251060 [Citrus unshiu]|uniref:Uncharacterized protein n=1 Tax=Citrus unshiu TaxID=55188 RepID=A0A2H5QQ24_CITUN|nr:hypothetical protein CUMW_251060 [Citrus unshiu]
MSRVQIPSYTGNGKGFVIYVSQILYEVLRLYSPAPLLTRANVKEIKLGELVIPPGCTKLIRPLVVKAKK